MILDKLEQKNNKQKTKKKKIVFSYLKFQENIHGIIDGCIMITLGGRIYKQTDPVSTTMNKLTNTSGLLASILETICMNILIERLKINSKNNWLYIG